MAKTKQENKKIREIEWRAAEFQYVPKGIGWYWLVGGCAAVLILFALYQKNFFFGIFIVLAGTMVIFFGGRKPRVFNFRIGEEGIDISGKVSYDYERLDGFAILEKPGRLDEIVLKKKTAVNPYVRIPIDDQTMIRAREILKDKLPEIEYQETFLEIVSDWFGF